MSYNKVILMGRLTKEPEMRYSPKGVAVLALDLATNRKWKTESGEEREDVCFVPVTAFGRTAEVIAQYLHKGDPILIDGRLTLETWTDKQTQKQRQKLKVTLETFTFIGGKKDGADPEPQPAPRNAPAPQGGNEIQEPDGEDSVPF